MNGIGNIVTIIATDTEQVQKDIERDGKDWQQTLLKARMSYNWMTCDSTPAANMRPAGSKQQMGFPSVLTEPWK